MSLRKLFMENPIDFEKRCRNRIAVGCLLGGLGLVSAALSFAAGGGLPVPYLDPGQLDFITSFYRGTGIGLIVAGLAVVVKNVRYLKNPELKKRREVYETDERNRLLGLRCWAYTGYAALIMLYLAILISGFISMTVLRTLLAVAAAYVVILLVFRALLQRAM